MPTKKFKLDGNRQHRREVRRAVDQIDHMYSHEHIRYPSFDNLQSEHNLQCEGKSPNPHDEIWMIDEDVTSTIVQHNFDESPEIGDVLMHKDCVNSLANKPVVFDDSEKESELSFQQRLASWSVGVPAHKLGDLLNILQNYKCFSYLPKDPRS